MSVSEPPSAGRPTRKTKKMIDKEVRFYYERDVGINEAMTKSGHSFRTIQTRYAKWDKLLREREDKSFLESQDTKKNRAILALDKQLVEVIAVQQEINKMINDLKNPAMDQLKSELRAKLAWMIFEMTDKKAALEMTPTTASRVKREVQELIDRYQKSPYSERELENSK